MSLSVTASRLLKQFGEPIEFKYTTGGGFDPATGAPIAGSEVVRIGSGYPGRYESNDIDGTVIRSGDIKLTVERISERPQVGWDVTVDGLKYRVQNVQNVRLSGEDIIYICQIRR
jgi:hypothetical protein